MEHAHVLVLPFLFFSVRGWKLSKIPWMRLCGWKWKETKLTVLFGLARHSNKKNPAARKMFWKKDKFNIDLDCGVTRKACISEDLSDHPSMGYHRGKEENTSQLKDSFHFSTCAVIRGHKFLAFLLWPVSKRFYNLFLYTWCHLTEWSGSLFPDRMGYKRVLDGETGYTHASSEERVTAAVKGSFQVRGRPRTAEEHSICREWERLQKEGEGRASELMRTL